MSMETMGNGPTPEQMRAEKTAERIASLGSQLHE